MVNQWLRRRIAVATPGITGFSVVPDRAETKISKTTPCKVGLGRLAALLTTRRMCCRAGETPSVAFNERNRIDGGARRLLQIPLRKPKVEGTY